MLGTARLDFHVFRDVLVLDEIVRVSIVCLIGSFGAVEGGDDMI